MTNYILNALTYRDDQETVERTLQYFWDAQDLFDSEVVESHISGQHLLSASIAFLLTSSLGLLGFSIVFLAFRFRGQCGAQKYQEYPTNSNNYALYLMLFFLSWVIVTSASAYFVLAGAGFWSEKLDGKRVIPNFATRATRSTAIADLFANKDYYGDFESVDNDGGQKADADADTDSPEDSEPLESEEGGLETTTKRYATTLRRVQIRRFPIPSLNFRAYNNNHNRIEIPMRPLAEVTYVDTSDKFLIKKKEDLGFPIPQPEAFVTTPKPEDDDSGDLTEDDGAEDTDDDDDEEAKKKFTMSTFISPPPSESGEEVQDRDQNQGSLVLKGHTMEMESEASTEKDYQVTEEVFTTTTTTTTTTTEHTTTTTVPTTTRTTTVPSTTTTSTTTTTTTPATIALPSMPPSTDNHLVTWQRVVTNRPKNVSFTKILPVEELASSSTPNPSLRSNYRSLHSRLVIFLCRLAFCLVSLLLAFVILPVFFFVVAGTGCYISSDHPMNRSSISNKIGKIVSAYAMILLFTTPLILLFATFTLYYTHSHELLCAAIQLHYQQSIGIVGDSEESVMEAYTINSNQCSRSLAPVQSLLLSSLLLCISILPCVFAMFKLVKYYYRMSSEFYWNAADNYAGRHYSKQQEFPRYQSTAIYPEEDMTNAYAVYGQI